MTDQAQTIAELNQELVQLEQEIAVAPDATTFEAQINQLKLQVAALNTTLLTNNELYKDLPNILALNISSLVYSNTTILVPQSNITVLDATLDYAGYIIIDFTSNSSITFSEVSYAFNNYTWSFNQTLGTSGSALFPVLPAEVKMVIGNLETENGAQVQATVTYYY